MTLDKLAAVTQAEFVSVRRDMAKMSEVMATKEDLRALEGRIIEEVRQDNAKVIQSNDRVVTKLDTVIQDFAAHDSLHTRITDDLHDHDTRIRKLENAKAA